MSDVAPEIGNPDEAKVSEQASGLRSWTKLRAAIGRLPVLGSAGGSAGVLIPLVLLWAALAIASPVFFTQINIANLLLQASIVGVLAFGSTVVLIVEEIDLSLGAVEGLAAVVAGTLFVKFHAAVPVAVAGAIGTGLVVGLVNGVITVYVRVPSFITTLATLGLATGVAQALSNGETISGFPDAYQVIGQQFVAFGLRLPVFVALGVLVAIYIVLRHTVLGLNFYAVGGNRQAARLAGIRAERIKVIALALSGSCAGLAGVLISARLNAAASTFGSADLLNAIAAVVIGGTALTGGYGSVVNTALGVLIIATVQNGLTLLNVSPLWTPAFVGGVILIAVVIHRYTGGRR